MLVPSYMKDTIAFLYIHHNGSFHAIGTGFFVCEIEAEFVFSYLVTCKHVVKDFLDSNEEIYVRFNRADGLDVDYVQASGDWLYHPDQAVDLAVLSWMPPKPGRSGSKWGAFQYRDIVLTEERLKEAKTIVTEGSEVLFMGLFAQYTGIRRNFPVVRHGRVALVTDEPIEGKYGLTEYLLIECQAYPGNSGSPLFLGIYHKEAFRLYLAGIIAAFYPEQQGVYVDQNTYQIYTHFGISTAVPVHKLSEVIYGDELMKRRKERVGAGRKEKSPIPASISETDSEEGVMTKEQFFDILNQVTRPVKPTEKTDKGPGNES